MGYTVKTLTLGALFDTTFDLLQKHWRILLVINGVALVPFYLVFVAVYVWGADWINSNPYWFVETPSWLFFFLVFALGGFFLALYATGAAVVKGVCKIYLDQPVTVAACYEAVWNKAGPLIWATSLAGLFTLLGYCLLFVPGLILQLMFFVLVPVIMLESVTGIDSLKRSRDLMRGEKGKAFFFLILVGIVWSLVDFVVKFIPNHFVHIAASSLFHLLFVVFTNVGTVIFYLQAKAGKENLLTGP